MGQVESHRPITPFILARIHKELKRIIYMTVLRWRWIRPIVACCCLCLTLRAETNTAALVRLAEDYVFRDMRSSAGERPMPQADIRMLLDGDPMQAYDALFSYVSHTNVYVRMNAYMCLGDVVLRGRGKGNPILERRYARELLSMFLEDNNIGFEHSLLRTLWHLPTTTFNDDLKAYIRRIHQTRGLSGMIVGLYEVADMRSDLPTLKSNQVALVWSVDETKSATWQYNSQWVLCRLLAKWGDRESCTNYLRRCESMITRDKVNYNVYDYFGLMKDCRDQLAVQILAKEFISEQHDDRQYVAACMLTELVDGFSTNNYRIEGWSEEEFERCREWVKRKSVLELKPEVRGRGEWSIVYH
jgi:hypothetical protein